MMAKKKRTRSGQYPLRLPDDLRLRIEKAAKGRDISLNAAILERLSRSFELEDRLGGPQVVKIIEVVGGAMRSTGHSAAVFAGVEKGSWLAHPYSFDQAVRAAAAVLEHHRPPGEIVVPTPNVVEVVGGDPKESVARLHQIVAELGPLMAAREIKKREQEK